MIDTETRRPSPDGGARFASSSRRLPARGAVDLQEGRLDAQRADRGRAPGAGACASRACRSCSSPPTRCSGGRSSGASSSCTASRWRGRRSPRTCTARFARRRSLTCSTARYRQAVSAVACRRSLGAVLAEPVPEERRGTVIICDAETDADLDDIAAALRLVRGHVLVAGSGGFAARWLSAVPAAQYATPPCRSPCLPFIRSAIVVCGSRHPMSMAQAAAAATAGYRCLVPAAGESADPVALAEELGRRAATALAEHQPDAVVLFGGDTAFAVLSALGCGVPTADRRGAPWRAGLALRPQ